MAEELQHLIDRIRKEAVESGEKQAAELVHQAKEKAAALVKEAEAQAKAHLEKAEKDAQAFTDRSTKTLQQAARDVLISIGQGVENVMAGIVDKSVEQALKPEVLEQMLVKVVGTYATKGQSGDATLEVLLSEQDQKTVQKLFAAEFQQKLASGVDIKVDNDVVKGFRVGYKGGQVYHDFTKEAIAESLLNFLRPQLAAIVHKAAAEDTYGKQDYQQ